MFKTIFSRLFWTTAAVVFITVVIVFVSMLGLLDKYVEDERLDSARLTAKSIEHMTVFLAQEGFDSDNMRFYEENLEAWSIFTKSQIAVVNSEKQVFATTDKSVSVPEKYVEDVLSGEEVNGKILQKKQKMRGEYIVGIPLQFNDQVFGGIFYIFPPSVGGSTVERFSHMLVVTLILAMLLALVLIYAEARQISKPIKKINTAVLEIASGKFDKRVEVNTSGEVAQLASSFNYMAESLKKLEEMRAEFVSDISHELRTPMTSISGFVEGILDGTIPKEKEREYLEIVRDESTRLAKLTNELFEMSKMESPEYKLSVQTFDVNEAIRRCIIGAEEKLAAKGLEVSVDFKNEIQLVVADPDAIKRVIINLLDNAVKFSYPENAVEISVNDRGKKVYIDFANYGMGISEKELPYIFDRFYKSDKSRGKDKAGAGLGLSFVKNILHLHGQNITVTSEPWGDDKMKTVFSFTLEKA